MSQEAQHRGPRPPIRWWPAIVIVTVASALLVWIWFFKTGSTQHQIIPTYPTLFFSAVLLLIWLVLFSRLPGRIRWIILMSTGLLVAAGFSLLEIKGVDGNLVPVVGYRWSADRSFDEGRVTVSGRDLSGSDDYPQFYGPARGATLRGPKLARDWQSRPPRELWRRQVGEGWSSFAVVGRAAVTQEQRGSTQAVVRYDLRTGQQNWVYVDGVAFDTTVGGRGPRATPTIVDGRVYAMNAVGVLSCLELDTGLKVWSRNVLDDRRFRHPDWGMASSPLVVGELVIVQLGRNGRGLAAYDRQTGEPVWHAGEDTGSYSSPYLTRLLERQLVLIVNHTSVQGHDPATGEIVLTADWPNPAGGERITMPLVVDSDRLLVSAGYGVGSRLYRFFSASDRIVGETIWESPRLKSKFAPMVIRDGVVYGLDDGILVALDPQTGERHWKRGRYGHGQMILVDDLLLIQAESGEVVLVEATPEEHRELDRLAALDGKTWNPPALSGNLLLVRNNVEAVCYELPLDN